MDLIKLSKTNKEFPVDSRDLHKFLEVETPHSIWMQRKCEDLQEGLDFTTDLLESRGRPTKVFHLAIDAAKHCSMMERSDKGKQIRQWFIEAEKKLRNEIALLTPTEMLIRSAQLLDTHEKELKRQSLRIDVVERNTSYESIHQMVQDSLVEETINEFPKECVKLEMIRETVFNDISEAVISKYLSHVKHPTKEYKFKMADNILRSITVFETKGLVDIYNRFRSESIYQKTTPKNVQFCHPVVGNYRIKR